MSEHESAETGSAAQPLWAAPYATDPVVGTVRVPGSKSITNRALVLAAISQDPSTIRNVLIARDSLLMLEAIRALGVDIYQPEANVVVVDPRELTGGVNIDVGLSGTMMRFVPPLAALAAGSVSIDGDAGARLRPTGPTVDALRQLGVGVTQPGPGSLPMTVDGRGAVTGSNVTIDSSESSQFVSGLLLSAPRFTHGLQLRHHGGIVPSLPHIAMTVEMLRNAGAQIEERISDPSDASWHVAPSPINLGNLVIEPDLSNAAAFLAAAMVTAGRVTVPDWPIETTQAGDEIRSIFGAMGARLDRDGEDLTLTGPEVLLGGDFDLRNVGELTPTIAAVACRANSRSRLTGIAHLRGHETDRLAALVTEINRLGGRASELPDGIEIDPQPMSAATVRTYHDHRMATFGAIVGLTTAGVEVEDIATTSKTMPEFPTLWNELVA